MKDLRIEPNTSETKYKIYENDELKYIVRRKAEYPNYWYAQTAAGQDTLSPEQFRYDLFAQLKKLP